MKMLIMGLSKAFIMPTILIMMMMMLMGVRLTVSVCLVVSVRKR